eukprot:GHVO01044861.1.p1 GENE.GHVO01044861.1~~GHVO01044861.1.p1  ORF type:complete len:177 (-),score=16.02 GHVO01044861.1:47-577(-)
MSGSTNYNNSYSTTSDIDANPMAPSHTRHSENDVLPGAKKGGHAVDYSVETMERTPSTWNERTEEQFAREQPGIMGADSAQSSEQLPERQSSSQGRNAFTETQRPMDVQPTAAGGVAVGGNSDLPEGKASMMDKLVGKTQKVIGKATHKPEMHEKGELRETGGKAAAQGEARAMHD